MVGSLLSHLLHDRVGSEDEHGGQCLRYLRQHLTKYQTSSTPGKCHCQFRKCNLMCVLDLLLGFPQTSLALEVLANEEDDGCLRMRNLVWCLPVRSGEKPVRQDWALASFQRITVRVELPVACD
jgi:hypothetical protein